jgi:2-keto-4-pentenoate hydratase/2-oxohepta-3-ene-1,7-dioic acid hydratase in catechol pathway
MHNALAVEGDEMRLASVRTSNGDVAAVVEGDEIVLLSEADAGLPADLIALIAEGNTLFARIAEAVASGRGRRPLADVALAPPVARPPKFFAVGLNYADHVAESGQPTPEFPTVFSKMPNAVAGPYDDIEQPIVSDRLDYEGELGFVIGQRCKHVTREDAPGVIAGYVVVNDLSVRDYQLRTPQWTLGKSFDTHGVIGPWIVTGDEIDPHALEIRTLVNGEERQHSNTRNLIFDCFAQVELLSSVATLEPGDIVATGTPGGVGIASNRFMKPGDVVRVEIEGIGAIENRVVREEPPEGVVTSMKRRAA